MFYVTTTILQSLLLVNIEAIAKIPLDSDQLQDLLKKDNHTLFQELRDELPENYQLEDNLLLYREHLCIRHNIVLCTCLIQEVHNQPSIAYPGASKTY